MKTLFQNGRFYPMSGSPLYQAVYLSTIYGCGNLKSIDIPEGVTSIGNSAFSGCHSLTSFTCLATNPPALGSKAFNDMNGTIYVPAASVEAYKAADGWKDYASQIQAIQE